MIHSFSISFAIITLSAVQIISGPLIGFDQKIFECGTVTEGKNDGVKAVFTVRNDGDSLLHLTRVKPGCGCTAVTWDSLIQPGGSAKIKAQINLKSYRPGIFSKKIVVTSNATNEQTSRLTVKALIRPIIGTSKSFISFSSDDTSGQASIFLSSIQKNLAVSSVTFTPDVTDSLPDEKARKNDIRIRFSFTPVDSFAEDGNRLFRLDLYRPETSIDLPGKFSVATNNRERKEIFLYGKIEGRKIE